MKDKMTETRRVDLSLVTGGRNRRMLSCGVSALALALSGLCATAAFADPSITYSGDASPLSGAGITDWTLPDGSMVTSGAADGTEAANLTLAHDAYNVTLTNTDELTLGYWDGTNTSAHGGTIDGGTGDWNESLGNWTIADGTSHGAWADANFAIFGGTAGTVTIDPAGITAAGMQFSVDGYKMTGGTLTLENGTSTPIIRVGDGSAGSDVMTATISSVIDGTHGLNKTGKGTLVLTGNNTYTGDTTISQGTLQLSDGTTDGFLASTNVINNGTLLFDNYALVSTFQSNISGTGTVVQKGTGNVSLNGNNSFTGGLTVASGRVLAVNSTAFGTGVLTVDANATADLGSYSQMIAGIAGAGTIHTRGSTLTLTQDDDAIFAGTFDHTTGNTTNALIKQGTGILALTGDNTGNVLVSNGTLRIGNDGATGSLNGAVIGGADTKLEFDRTDSYTYAGVISGDGTVHQIATGTTVLTGDSTYTGGTNANATVIERGTLQIGANGTTGSIQGNVLNGSALAFDRSDVISFAGVISGTGHVNQIGDGDLTLSGANTFSGGLDVQKGTAKAGIADVAFGTGLLSVEMTGIADLNGFNTTVAGLSGEGQVNLTDADLTLNGGDEFSGTISGTGGLIQDGGAQVLSGISDYSGATTINSGQLQLGSDTALSNKSAYTVNGDGTLDMAGFSGTVASLTNAGTITSTGAVGYRLNVAGNYTGQNGKLSINTVLGDDNSNTDQLIIAGDTSGSTMVVINNVGGDGEKTVNGIKVIDIGGTSSGEFKLANGYTSKDNKQVISAGAYAYALQKGGTNTTDDGNWYLSSTVVDNSLPTNPQQTRYSAGVPIYEGYIATMQTLNKLSTLQQRVGDRYLTGQSGNGVTNGAIVDDRGIWARVEGEHNRLEPNTSTTRMKQEVNTFIMQAGVDGQFYDGEDGNLIAGITGQYGHGRADISSFPGDGTITTDAWSLGATATWYSNNGFYLDNQAQITWFDNDLGSWTANTGLGNGKKATGYALSMEAGQSIAIDGNRSLTPQAQLMWSSIDADAFNDVWGAHVSTDDTASLTGRLGLAANYRNNWKGNDGMMVNTSVYGIANLYQDFLSGSSVNIAGVKFDTDNDRTWGGVGFGGTYAWADNKYVAYGEASVNTSLNHFADSYTLKGTVGLKVKW